MNNSILIIFFGLVFMTTFVSCSNKNVYKKQDINKQIFDYANVEHNDRLLSYKFRDSTNYGVKLIFPNDKAKACILMLHGWNLDADEWCQKTEFCDEALKRGYILIIPDLQKCNYPLHIYPETRQEYRTFPDLQWIIDTVIKDLQINYNLLISEKNNFVAGISTGARGASLLAYYLPRIFRGMASLSGDFNITLMPDEFLYRAWFGEYENFPERWKNECFAFRCNSYIVPSYIAHGRADKTSPVEQSIAMYDSLMKTHPELNHKSHFPDLYGHDYNFWNSETYSILNFFDSLCK